MVNTRMLFVISSYDKSMDSAWKWKTDTNYLTERSINTLISFYSIIIYPETRP